jgi:hypothetical protein
MSFFEMTSATKRIAKMIDEETVSEPATRPFGKAQRGSIADGQMATHQGTSCCHCRCSTVNAGHTPVGAGLM